MALKTAITEHLGIRVRRLPMSWKGRPDRFEPGAAMGTVPIEQDGRWWPEREAHGLIGVLSVALRLRDGGGDVDDQFERDIRRALKHYLDTVEK